MQCADQRHHWKIESFPQGSMLPYYPASVPLVFEQNGVFFLPDQAYLRILQPENSTSVYNV